MNPADSGLSLRQVRRAYKAQGDALDALENEAGRVGFDVARVLVELAARSARPLEGD